MRLIDADALIEVIKKYKFGAISNESEREYTREIMLCFVNGSSTAYDVEKVVAELEEESDYEPIDYDYFDMSCSGEEHFISTHKAIDIVRKGGVV